MLGFEFNNAEDPHAAHTFLSKNRNSMLSHAAMTLEEIAAPDHFKEQTLTSYEVHMDGSPEQIAFDLRW